MQAVEPPARFSPPSAPHTWQNLVIGRMYDHHLLDMADWPKTWPSNGAPSTPTEVLGLVLGAAVQKAL